MPVRRERIDRRLAAATPIVLDQPADTIVVFRDGWGEVTKRYDLGRLGLPSDVARLLADAFRIIMLPRAGSRSVIAGWRCGHSRAL